MKTVTHTHSGLRGHSAKRLIAMLALQLAFVFLMQGAGRGQNYSYPNLANVEYGKFTINQYKVGDGDHFPSDPSIKLTMDCLAANGYGQWTVSSATGNNVEPTTDQWVFSPNQGAVTAGQTWVPNSSSGWFLLGNLIGKPSESFDGTSSHPGCQPPGVVSGGTFNDPFPATPKVAANLNGRVRYVWVEPTNRLTFKVEGLNDGVGQTPAERQIDISLGSLPNPPVNRQIVKKIISNYPSAGGDVSTIDVFNNPHKVATEPTGGFHQDEFDIAMDKKFLYIVWESVDGGIYVTVIKLSDGSIATTTFQVSASGTHPTIACDVRNSPTTPFFAVAFIDGGDVRVGEFSGNNVQHGGLEKLFKSYNDPNTTNQVDNYTCGATHARVVVSSVTGSSHVTSVYVRECDELIFFNNLSWLINQDAIHWNDIAYYVDGIRPYQGLGIWPLPLPIPQGVDPFRNGVSGIVDAPIVAFANPYDNQSGTYNQFHCLYQLSVTNLNVKPLILVRGADNGLKNNPGGNLNDTRLLLNQEASSTIQADPTSYCGAVNQMGIHIHWRSNNAHFYVRDTRAFDEDIEENTLVTNVCYLANGASHGGSSSGALVKNEANVTVWTDPNYAAGVTSGGSYLQYFGGTADNVFLGQENIGTLSFFTSGLTLSVGNIYNNSGHLNTMPLCNISKSPSSAGTITVYARSTWDYYGTPIHNGKNWDNLTINLQGWNDPPQDPATEYGLLNIHGGAIFWECPSFTSDIGNINILFENSISPLKTDGSTNDATTGLFEVSSIATINNSLVNSFLPSSTWVDDGEIVVMHLTAANTANRSNVFTLNSTNTSYSNYASLSDMTAPGGGVGSIFYDFLCSDNNTLDKVVFDGGSFNRIRFRARGPGTAGLEITHNSIDQISLDAIHITSCSSTDYADINVSDNTFLSTIGDFDPDFGILIENFNATGRRGQVNIKNNKFNYVNSPSTGSQYSGSSAIKFINSTGNIIGNNITDHAYYAGITITSNDGNMTHAYLCNNYIHGLIGDESNYYSGIGIVSDHYLGYISLNQISGCTIGYQSKSKDNPLIVFSSINNCHYNGIDILGATSLPSEVDLTGIHGNNHDIAAFDTISGNATSTFDGITHAQVMLADGNQLVDYGNLGGYNNWGQNNTIRSTTTPLLIGLTTGNLNIGSVDGNFWGFASDGTTQIDPGNTKTPLFGGNPNPCFTNTFVGNWNPTNCGEENCHIGTTTTGFAATAGGLSSGWNHTSGFTCSGYTTNQGIGWKGNNPLSVNDVQVLDSCAQLKNWEYVHPQDGDYQTAKEQYDTLRMYIEKCAASDDQSFHAFLHIDGAVQLSSNDTNRFAIYRNWLISVLYLNKTNPEYFCVCMGSIAGTYQMGKYKPLGYLAVLNYLRQNHHECWGAGDSSEYAKDSIYDAQNGYDVKHLPSLDSMGLGFLLKAGIPSPSSPFPSQYLVSFTSSPNPFIEETTLQFTLNRMTYTTIAVYDELGRLVWGDGRGLSLEAGMHQVHLDGKNLPSGTLYARISTGFGEVKTVKLVHEK